MLDLLPDLSGQPGWVVVVVFGLLVIGTVGTKWVSRNARDDEQDDVETDRPAPPGLQSHSDDVHTALAITKALDLLANEAVESQGARAEVDRLRTQLLECSAERERFARDLAKAQADLEQCNRECRRLAMRALERGGDSSE